MPNEVRERTVYKQKTTLSTEDFEAEVIKSTVNRGSVCKQLCCEFHFLTNFYPGFLSS